MSLRDFNIDGKMMNKTLMTLFVVETTRSNILGDPSAVSRQDDNVFWLTRTKSSNTSGLTHPT